MNTRFAIKIIIAILSMVLTITEDNIAPASLVDSLSENQSEAANASNAESEDVSNVSGTTAKFSKIIFFGDSRFDYLAPSTPESENFVALTGAQYEWMESHVNEVLSMYTEDSVILIEFGVNDCWDLNKYVELANSLAEQGYNVAYLTLLPVEDEKAVAANWPHKNAEVEVFNMMLYELLDSRIIILDGYSYLTEQGFETYDGIHYTDDTNAMLYRYMVDNLRNSK